MLLAGALVLAAQGGITLELHVEPVLELWCEARALGATATAAEDEEAGPLAPALSAARGFEAASGRTPWAQLADALALEASDATELHDAFEELPPTLRAPTPAGVRERPLRAPAQALAAALVPLEAGFRATSWPSRRAALAATADALRTRFAGPVGAAVREAVERELGLRFPPEALRVALVTRAAPPGGATTRGPAGPLSVVALDGRSPTVLTEVLLHELLHAVEARGAEGSLFAAARARLSAAGLEARSPALRTAVHTLYFVAAADLVRRYLDPEHIPYGVTSGVYERSAPWAEYWRAAWPRWQAGELSREALLEGLGEVAARELAAEK